MDRGDSTPGGDDLERIMTRLRRLAAAAGRGDADCFGSYHNHTTWSDGVFSPEALLDRALHLGFSELGISDHGYTEKGGIRCVHDSQIDAYRAALLELRHRYRSQIRLLIGLEVDSSRFNPNRFELRTEPLSQLDYVLFEYVGERHWDGMALEEFLAIRREIRCPVGLAHPAMPELIAAYGPRFLAETLASHDIFIDACGSARNSRAKPYERPGLTRGFTLNIEALGTEFKDAARVCGLKFLPSSDTHRDDSRDALAATINAMATIVRYDLRRMSFDDGDPTQ